MNTTPTDDTRAETNAVDAQCVASTAYDCHGNISPQNNDADIQFLEIEIPEDDTDSFTIEEEDDDDGELYVVYERDPSAEATCCEIRLGRMCSLQVTKLDCQNHIVIMVAMLLITIVIFGIVGLARSKKSDKGNFEVFDGNP